MGLVRFPTAGLLRVRELVVARGPRVFRSPRQPRRVAAWLLAFVVVLGVGALGSSSRAWATNVSGTISTNTTWTLANSPYVLTGNVTVASSATLTIEPGVVVQGNATSRTLIVQGALAAEGTSGSPITFTSSADSAPGQWNGLRFDAGSGASSLKWVNVRYGGNGISEANGMVDIRGGTVSIEDSTITRSVVSGAVVSSATDGSGMLVTVKRSKFEANGFSGSSKRGDGLRAFNARVVVEDSAFWSNAIDGIQVHVPTGYVPASSAISGSSMWNNERFGVYIFQDSGLEGLGPDGNVSGKPGNAVYDNGEFTWGVGDFWYQMQVTRASGDVDWAGTYWGPVSVAPCSLGSQRGHISFAAPFPDPLFALQIARGPVEYLTATSGADYCANDNVVVDAPAYQLPDLYFDAPPPIFGGLTAEQTFGTDECCLDDGQLASTADRAEQAYSPQPVNIASGSLSERATDLRLAGPGLPFAWSRQYDSRDTTGGALGTGWTHTYEAKLTVVNPTTGELEYRAGSGQRTRFTKTNGGSSGTARYQGKGFDGTLKRLSNNSYELTTRDQRTFSFDSSGNLTQIKPRFRPATTLAYTSGKLSSITDSAGRSIAITYSAGTPTLVDRVTLPDGRYVEYGYTSGRLTSVRDARGKTWTIAYDGNGRLASIQDPVGRFELQDVLYDSQGRVTSEENGAGDAITYAYSTSGEYDVTTVTLPGRGSWVYKHRGYLLMSVLDPLNRTTSFTYDGQGRQSTVTDGRGNTRRFEYDVYGNLRKEVAPSPLGYTITRTFNATNDPLTETDGRGNPATYAYATGSDAAADYQVGQLKSVTDRENGVTTLKYWTTTSSPTPPSTNVGLLKSVSNQRSKTSTYDYDSSGNLTKITSPLGLKTTFGYDASGRLTSMRDPRGNVPNPPAGYLSEWTYDAVDHVKTLTDARGHVTTLDYYDNELLWKQTRVDTGGTNRITSFDYDSDNRLWKTTDPRNGVETRLYWADGLLKSIESAEARKTSYAYDNAGQLTSLVEPNGNAAGGTPSDFTWTFGYDNAGNRTSEAHPDAGTTTISYDALNRPTQWTDALSHTNSVSYDANDNITQSTNGLSHSRTYTYDKLDWLKTETDERSKTWTYAYYASGELESLTTPLGNKTSYTLDDDGRVTGMVEPRGNASGATASDYTWTYEYDPAGNRTQVTDPLGNELNYEFSAVNDITKITDERGNETTYTYDVLNRLHKVTPPAAGASGTLDTEYAYDAAGNLASRTDPKGHTTSWAYDLDALLTSRTTPVGVWNWTYDANGNVKTLEKPSGSSTQTAGDGTITYGYDRMSRLTSIDYSDSTPDVSATYDLAGRLGTMTNGAGGTVSYTHDNADRLTGVERTGASAGLNGTLSYGYDNAGNITSRTYPDSTSFTQTFDDDSRIASVATGGQTTSFGYDAAANLTSVTHPSGNGHVATRTFDRAGRLSTVENAKAGTILSKFLWTLDAAGNPTKAQTTRGSTDTYDAYEYDTRNRLTASCFGVASSATNCSGASNAITYAYDKVSNRTQEVRTGSVGNTGTIDYTYNNADQLTSTVKGGTTTSYTYDANGNQATAGTRSFAYDLADRQTSATVGGTTTTYGYDGSGQRVSAVTGGGGPDLWYVWDELADAGTPQLALERTSSGAHVRRYTGSPLGAVSFTDSSGTFSYHRDVLGSVTDVTDSSGGAKWRYEYEAFGAERSATNVPGTAPVNRLRFTGEHLDPETTLYHLRARQHDPALGRFGALDPAENPIAEPYPSAYAYVKGQPTVLVDPLGLYGIRELGRDIGTFGAGTADAFSFGGSTWLLNRAGIRPDTSSLAFQGGRIAAYLAPARGGLRLVTLLAARNYRAASAGLLRAGGTGALGVGIGYAYSSFTCAPYTLEDAALASLLGIGGIRHPSIRRPLATKGVRGTRGAGPGARYPLHPKIQRQLGTRGWTTVQIDEAIQSGQQVRAVNKATGNPATRYIHPETGQSVVVDDVTGQVIHVGGPGFKYGPGSGDVP